MMTIRAQVALALLFAFSAGQVKAQIEVKRFPCKDLNVVSGSGAPLNRIYDNRTGITQYIHVQITRNGCSPKELLFWFGRSVSPYTSRIFVDSKEGKRFEGVGFNLLDDESAVLYVIEVPGKKTRGTIDFTYMID